MLFMDRLILFDVDGTLTHTQNGFQPFNAAIFKTFGVAGDIRSVIPDGNTDPLIVKEIFATACCDVEISTERWATFERHLAVSYAKAIREGSTTVRALPGVEALLAAIRATPEMSQGVVTGNLQATARIKLDAAGIATYFRCGAYASDSHDRQHLPPIAKQRWEKESGRRIASEACVIVGDTPKDLECARKNKMKCVLVGTGRYPVEELAYWNPDALVPDLSETAAMMEMLSNL